MKKTLSLVLIVLWSAIIFAQDIVFDVDSNQYHTVTIEGHTWLKENLKVSHYNNGDKILTSNTFDFTIKEEAAPKYQWIYEDDPKYLQTYGRLYTFYVVVDSRKICPAGWRVATDDDWSALEKALDGRSKAGGKLKEGGFKHWKTPNKGKKNRTGFSALPSGQRLNENIFDFIGIIGYWWTATEISEKVAYTRRMLFQEEDCNRTGLRKDHGLAVRCIIDN